MYQAEKDRKEGAKARFSFWVSAIIKRPLYPNFEKKKDLDHAVQLSLQNQISLILTAFAREGGNCKPSWCSNWMIDVAFGDYGCMGFSRTKRIRKYPGAGNLF